MNLIAAASKSAYDVNLSFGCRNSQYGHQWHFLPQVGEALMTNSDLISLTLTFFCEDPCDVFYLDSLLEALTGHLQSLSLEFRRPDSAYSDSGVLPVPDSFLVCSHWPIYAWELASTP
jgi:hypothetical protein